MSINKSMNPLVLKNLIDPDYHTPFHIEITSKDENGDIISGKLESSNGKSFFISNGIPRLVNTSDKNQLQTKNAFSYKWKKRDSYDSIQGKGFAQKWLLEKYGFGSIEEWVDLFSKGKNILDAGCGSGFSSSLWLESPSWDEKSDWFGVDISDAIDVAQERLGHIRNTHFIQADLLKLPFHDSFFDFLFSEGVLHHTPSTREALISVSRVLKRGGIILFYVYRKKGPIREYTDDFIRNEISSLSEEEAWSAMRTFTTLGKALTEQCGDIDVPIDIPLLGIKAGKTPIQRFIYYNFAKLFWNQELNFEENVHINFDWYRPHYAHRQTEGEVRLWCKEANLSINWFHEEESGFAVRAIKL